MHQIILGLPTFGDETLALSLVREAAEAEEHQTRAKAALLPELFISLVMLTGWWLCLWAALPILPEALAADFLAVGKIQTAFGVVVLLGLGLLGPLLRGVPHRLPLFSRTWRRRIIDIAVVVALGPLYALARAAFQISTAYGAASFTVGYEERTVAARAILNDPRTLDFFGDLSEETARWADAQRAANRLIALSHDTGLVLNEEEERAIAECAATRELLVPRMRVAAALYAEGDFGTVSHDAAASDAIRRAKRLLPDLTDRCEAVTAEAERLLAQRETQRTCT